MFPGILLHELAHWLACKILFVRVSRFHVSLFGGHGFVEYERPGSILKALVISTAPPLAALPIVSLLLWVYPHCPAWLPEYLAPHLPDGWAAQGASSISWGIEILRWLVSLMLLYTSLPSDLDTRFNRGYSWWRRLVVLPLWLTFRLFYLFTRSQTLGYTYALLMLLLIRLMPLAIIKHSGQLLAWFESLSA